MYPALTFIDKQPRVKAIEYALFKVQKEDDTLWSLSSLSIGDICSSCNVINMVRTLFKNVSWKVGAVGVDFCHGCAGFGVGHCIHFSAEFPDGTETSNKFSKRSLDDHISCNCVE